MARLAESVRPSNALLHPLWWAALVLLLFNDHAWKGSGYVSPLVTGKLSDVSGLLMAPALVATLLCVRTWGGWILCHAGVALAFSALKLSTTVAGWFIATGALFGLAYAVAPDATDLFALASVVVSAFVFGRVRNRSLVRTAWARVVTLVGMSVGIAGTVATSKMRAYYVAVDGNEVHVINDRSSVDIFDARTGTLKRSVKFDASHLELGVATTQGAALRDGFIHDRDGRALDVRTGDERFEFPSDEAAIGISGKRIFACVEKDAVAAYDLRTGKEAWRRQLRCTNAQSTVSERVVAVYDGEKYAELLDVATGATRGRAYLACVSKPGDKGCWDTRWELLTLYPELAGIDPVPEWTRAVPRVLPPRPGAPPLFFIDGKLVAFDPVKKAAAWSVPANALIVALPTVVVAGTDKGIEAFDAATGAPRWKHGGAEDYGASDAILALYTHIHGGAVTAIDLATGRDLWVAVVPR
jgi:outer membrane protein assembly factor BamB